MGTIDGILEPVYFLITSIAFIILAVIHYKKVGKTIETGYLFILGITFLVCYFILFWNPKLSPLFTGNFKI